MALKIEARRWIAVVYRCPRCGAQSGELMLTPWQWAHRRARECFNYKRERAELVVAEHKWYTTFAIEPGLSGTTIAGTLASIGPFKICNIVHPNIRLFRRWYRRRKAEEAEKLRAYLERERRIEAEYKARLARQRQEAALLREVEAIAYQRDHAAELAAERVARAVWPVESPPARQSDPGSVPILGGEDDFDPFEEK